MTSDCWFVVVMGVIAGTVVGALLVLEGVF